jgi:hypothetical protein
MPTTESPRPNNGPEPEKSPRLFLLGRCVLTPGAREACAEADVDPNTYLNRHVTGDWGDLEEDDRAANDAAVLSDARILSAYTLSTDERLWIITEADRAYTTLLTPIEY